MIYNANNVISGVEKLAGMSLNNPKRISILENNTSSTVHAGNEQTKSDSNLRGNEMFDADSEDKIALPHSLKQYFVITPCKLRLVVLLTLILSKCKVGDTVFIYVHVCGFML